MAGRLFRCPCQSAAATVEESPGPRPARTTTTRSTMELATLPLAARKPVRLSITIPHGLYRRIEQQASYEGRSMSNLAAHLLEISLSGRID